MRLITRKLFSTSRLKRTLTEKLRSRRRLKLGDATIDFILLSYLVYMKNLGKLASLNALMDKKTVINKEHIYEAHQNILETTKVKRKQRTLDEMLKRK